MPTATLKPSVLVTLQNAAAANGDGTEGAVAGHGTVAVQVSGTFSATVNFEGTVDGTNWLAVQGVNAGTGAVVSAATAPGLFLIPVAGLDKFRARVSGYTSGSVTVTARAVQGPVTSAADLELAVQDIQIGAVEIKNAMSDDRATVAADGRVAADANLQVANADVDGTNRVPVDLDGDSADLDSGAGTDNHPVVALGAAAAGGHVVLPGDVTNGLDVDVTRMPNRSQAVSPANYATTDAFADVTGATLDTHGNGEKFLAFLLKEVGGANGVTFRVRGSVDGLTYTTIVGPIGADGVEDADGEVAVAASGSQEWFITPEYDSGAKVAYRHYTVQAKSTTAGNAGSAQVRIFAK